MIAMKLFIEAEFEQELSPRAQQELKIAIQELKTALYLGKVTRAELVKQ